MSEVIGQESDDRWQESDDSGINNSGKIAWAWAKGMVSFEFGSGNAEHQAQNTIMTFNPKSKIRNPQLKRPIAVLRISCNISFQARLADLRFLSLLMGVQKLSVRFLIPDIIQ